MGNSKGPLLAVGENLSRWWCADCGQLFKIPRYKVGNQRFHSSLCQAPLTRVRVHMEVDDEQLQAM